MTNSPSGPDQLDQVLAFHAEHVQPTMEEFREDPSDIRRALLASLIIDCWLDHIFAHAPSMRRGLLKTRKGRFDWREAITGDCQELAWVRDIAEITKHHAINRGSAELSVFEAVQAETQNYFVSGYVETGYARERYVLATLPDGTKHDVLPLVEEASRFLLAHVQQNQSGSATPTP